MEEENNLPPEELEQEEQKQGPTKQKKEENKKTLKTVITSVICIILFIIILLLLILLGFKKCAPAAGANLSSNDTPIEEPIDTVRNGKITDVFLEMVDWKIKVDGYDADTLTNVVAVSYEDNYPNTFNIAITAVSENKVYYYTVDNYNYQGDKTTYSDFLTYLLQDSVDLRMPYGDVDLNPLQKISTHKDSDKYYVTSRNAASDNFFYGFYKNENNEFNVYQQRLYTEGEDAFSKEPDKVIKQGDALHNYYRGLLA